MNDNNSGRDILMENTSANNSLRFSMEDQVQCTQIIFLWRTHLLIIV